MVNEDKTFKIDYFSKYYFYTIEEFKKEEEDSEYIIDKINECNRLDYKGYTYKYSKYNNIVKGETKKNIYMTIDKEHDYVIIDGNKNRLDLSYKYDTKQLEDHIRIATKICNDKDENSCLIYINNKDSSEFLNTMDNIKEKQIKLMENNLH